MTIRVLIADDHKVVADGLVHLLRAHEGIEVVGSASSGREAVRQAIELDPDVVLMDSSMADLNGIEATRKLRERGSRAHVIMLSVHAEPPHVVRALRAGADGYVPKSSAGADVIEAIRTVASDKRYLRPAISHDVLARLGPVALGPHGGDIPRAAHGEAGNLRRSHAGQVRDSLRADVARIAPAGGDFPPSQVGLEGRLAC